MVTSCDCRQDLVLVAIFNQSCIEACADLSAGVVVQKDILVIHENFMNGHKSQCTTVVAESDRH